MRERDRTAGEITTKIACRSGRHAFRIRFVEHPLDAEPEGVGDAEQRGIKEGQWVRIASRAGETALRALVTDRVAPGVVYTTFHHPLTQANVITTDFSDWATNCPEYKVTAVQVAPTTGPTRYQEEYEAFAMKSREIQRAGAGAPSR